jgi:hypothetical protein
MQFHPCLFLGTAHSEQQLPPALPGPHHCLATTDHVCWAVHPLLLVQMASAQLKVQLGLHGCAHAITARVWAPCN